MSFNPNAGHGPPRRQGRGRVLGQSPPRFLPLLLLGMLLLLMPPTVQAQYRTAREAPSDAGGTPLWTNSAAHKKDVFTFVRIKYSRKPNLRRWRGSGSGYWYIEIGRASCRERV